jgi:hypothetical protein
MEAQKHLEKKLNDEECKVTIEEMKKAREKWLMKRRRENEE